MTNEKAIEILKTIEILSYRDKKHKYFAKDVLEAQKVAIKALEQQPSEDCISREEAIRVAEQGQIQGYEWQFKKLCDLPSVTPQPKVGYWIEKASTYYEELKKRGLGVDEYTPYFTDDIACSECLAKYSVIDNETQFFKFCPNCGAKMEVEE